MKNKKKRYSFSSNDDVPLNHYAEKGSDHANSYKSLCQTSLEGCEFCDKVFKNRYNSLIHNAAHIIIPLLNQNIIRCQECLFCFTSESEFKQHVRRKHMLTNCNGALESVEKCVEPIKMRNRLKFEDDDCLNYSTDILEDLPTECKVTLNLFNKSPLKVEDNKSSIVINISDDESSVFKNKCEHDSVTAANNSISLLNTVSDKLEVIKVYKNLNGTVKHYDSVHCDILKQPKPVRCRHCNKKFPDRYNLIIHEASHIGTDKRLPHLCTMCDWYIAGTHLDLKRHMETHALETGKVKFFTTLKKCLHCGLMYRNLSRHTNNYHKQCRIDEMYDKIIHVCDLCYEFLKSRTDRHYIKQGILSRVGERHPCNQCTRMFFELNIVKMRMVIHNWVAEKRVKKKLTNRQRLDKIQNRLAQINKLGRL